jgi:hypothetical protein
MSAAAYGQYREALSRLAAMPANAREEVVRDQRTAASARQVANRAAASAERTAQDADQAIGRELADARSSLAELSASNLVPPRVLPGSPAAPATRDDVAAAQRALVEAVEHLRAAVVEEHSRRRGESERLAHEAAERARLQVAAEAARLRRNAALARRRRVILAAAALSAVSLAVTFLVLSR